MYQKKSYPCDCPCHSNPNIRHATACCEYNPHQQTFIQNTMTQDNNENLVEAKTLNAVDAELNAAEIDEVATTEASYLKFRKTIAKHFGAVAASGKPFFYGQDQSQEANDGSFGIMSLDNWRLSVPQSRQQHYNCNRCRTTFQYLSVMAYMEDDGTVRYPLAEAVKELADDPIIANMLKTFPEVEKKVHMQERSNSVAYVPVSLIASFVIDGKDGGFDHFYGLTHDEAVAYNAKRQGFGDYEYIKTAYQSLTNPALNLDLLEKVFKYVKNAIGEKEHTALSRSDAFIAIARKVRELQKLGGVSFSYVWALLEQRDHSWLKHFGRSVLGYTVQATLELRESTNLEAALHRIKSLLSTATAPENYKNKTAEASENSIDATYTFLVQNGLENALARRLMHIDEVTSTIWRSSEVVKKEVEAVKPVSALDAARQELKAEKNPDTALNNKLDDILGTTLRKETMSAKAFLESLDKYAKVAIARESNMVAPVFATTSFVDGDYEKLLNFDKLIGKDVMLLTVPKPVGYHIAAGLSSPDAAYPNPLPEEIPVEAIFKSRSVAGEVDNVVFHMSHFGANLQRQFAHHGSAILGSALVSEHFGHSRAVVELSRKIPMEVTAGPNAAGGIFLKLGYFINVVTKEGDRIQIQVTSVE